MAERVTNEQLYEALKAVQGGIAKVERGLAEMRAELQSKGEHLAALSASYATLVSDGVRRADQIAELRARIERIERRLDVEEPSI